MHSNEFNKKSFDKLDKLAFFSALCMFLSMIEYAVPKPLPFMRIGFANMSVMLSLFVLSVPETFLLVLIKVLLQAVISGTLFSYVFLFSFCSSFFALFFMLAVKAIFKNHISFVGISLAGSLGNNLSQIALSYALIFKSQTSYIAPILLVTGLVSSLVLGIFVELFTEKSEWYKMITKNDTTFVPGTSPDTDTTSSTDAISTTITTSSTSSADTARQSDVLNFPERKKFSWKSFFKQLLRDLILLISIVFFSLMVPSGKVLFTLGQAGKFKITQGALFVGLKRALILILSVQISKLIVPKKIVLKGKFGSFLNLILIYFRKLSEFQSPRKSRKEKNKIQTQSFIQHLDEHFLKASQKIR